MLDLEKYREEFRCSLEQALECEHQRQAENNERLRRCYEDQRAFQQIRAEITARILDLRKGLRELAGKHDNGPVEHS